MISFFKGRWARWKENISAKSPLGRLLLENLPEHRNRYLAAILAMIIVASMTAATAWMMGQIVVDFAPMPKRDRHILDQVLKSAFRAEGETNLAGWTDRKSVV